MKDRNGKYHSCFLYLDVYISLMNKYLASIFFNARIVNSEITLEIELSPSPANLISVYCHRQLKTA